MFKSEKSLSLMTVLLCVYLVIEVLVVNQDTLDITEYFVPIVVFNIFTKLPVHILSQIFISFFLFLFAVIKCKGTIRIGVLGPFFVFRFITGIIQILYLNISGAEIIRMGNYLLWVSEALLYWGMLNDSKFFNNKYFFKTIIKLFIIIISVQTVVQSVVGVLPQVPYMYLFYKGCMRIPIGGSNAISAYIIPVLSMVMLGDEKKCIIDKILIPVSMVAIILTKSRTGISLLLIVVIICLLKMFKSSNRNLRFLGLCSIVVLFVVTAYVIAEYADNIITVFSGYSSIVESDSFLDRITSSRTSMFGWYFEKIIYSPIIGNGPNYIASRAHMIIIDLLYQNGIIGLLLFARPVLTQIKKSTKNNVDKDIKLMMILILLNSLIEISIFTSFPMDILFFFSLTMLENDMFLEVEQ